MVMISTSNSPTEGASLSVYARGSKKAAERAFIVATKKKEIDDFEIQFFLSLVKPICRRSEFFSFHDFAAANAGFDNPVEIKTLETLFNCWTQQNVQNGNLKEIPPIIYNQAQFQQVCDFGRICVEED